jgi:hypothetical protein
MVNLINIVSGMINSLDLYENAMEKNIKKRDYFHLCLDARNLLDSLGENQIEEWDLKVNSEQFKRGLHALKTMSGQLEEDIIDSGIVKSCYRKFKENCYTFMKELFEFYIMNE